MTSLLTAAAVAVGVLTAADAQAATCAPAAAGGEWREYSHDLNNTRNQPEENVIDAAQAADLQPVWRFKVVDYGGSGVFHHDPIVADGCVYLASTSGWVYSLNADTGQLIWSHKLTNSVSSSPTVKGGKVYIHVSKSRDPRLVVLDQASGELLWEVALVAAIPEADRFGTELISSPKVFNGKIFSGISGAGAESGNTFAATPLGEATGFNVDPKSRLRFRGIYAISDEATQQVSTGYTIPQDDFVDGYSGGGIWSSAAIDTEAGFAYVGSGNPFSPKEHDNTNSILKIDVDTNRPTFGQIVASYHGTTDQYVDGVRNKPVCEAYVDVFTCETSDFDFGASPQLFDIDGTKVVGAHQKAGVYHVAERAGMTGVWKQTVGAPFGWFGGEGTASFDGETVLVPGNTPGLLSRLDKDTGAQRWVAPIADGIHFTSLTTANGVAYVVDTRGLLDVFDTATGLQLAAKHLPTETNQPTESGFSTGYSVSVARNTVFVPYAGAVVAYR